MELKAIDVDGLFFPPGEVIAGRFTLRERIGEGPFGQVFRAEDTLIEADVALKVFASEVVRSPIDEERFLKSTRRARALTQKNVVRLHDSGVHRDHPWVSMQYLEGLNLRKVVRLRRERGELFSLEELEPILSQITLALQHIGRDFPHGDLKPENIIFLPDLLKVTDSYIYAAVAEDIFAQRIANNPFIAPELQVPGAGAGSRCDVFSVGAIIGYMVFGEDYEPGSQAGDGGVRGNVDALCRRAMAFDPQERYASVEALNEDFTSIVDTGRLLQRRVSSKPPEVPATVGSRGVRAPAAPLTPVVMPPPTAPAPVPAKQFDPLDVETAPDIGDPLQRDVVTTEYERDTHAAELGDLLPTNEVDRNRFPKTEPVKPAPPQPVATPRTPPRANTPVAAPVQRPVKSTEKKPEKDASSFRSIVLGLFVGGIILVVLFAVVSNQNVSPGEVPVQMEGAEAIAADEFDGLEAAEEEGSEQELARLQVTLVEEVEAKPRMAKALAAAAEAARERGQEMEQERAQEEEQDEEAVSQEVAVASSGQAGAPVTSTGAPGRDSGASSGAQQGSQSSSTGAGAEASSQGTDCPSGMVLVSSGGGNVCVDAYEYPGRGRMPSTGVSWFEARRICQQQDKRLCALSEWRSACGAYYPYGRNYDADRCNTADIDGFERPLAAAGASAQCRSASGAYDMSGNVHEWVEEQRVAGGGFDSEADLATCRYSSPKAPASTSGNVGFRCCASPS